MDKRIESQKKVVDLYLKHSTISCTLVLSTGYGKSKIAIDILKKLKPKKILILVNSIVLRDFNWILEFKKFKALRLLKRTELVTYQTAYKWTKKEKDLSDYFIIADEVDFAADTIQLSKFFYEYKTNTILGLTGFISKDKQVWFQNNLPILTEISAAKAQELNILNKIHFVFIKYDLDSNNKTHTVTYLNNGEEKSFQQTENSAYNYLQQKITKLLIEKKSIELDFEMGVLTYTEKYNLLNINKSKLQTLNSDRAELLCSLKSSKILVGKLIHYLQSQHPDNKILIFSKRTAQSNAICGENNIYNETIPNIKANSNFKNFQVGTIKYLGVCNKVNRGVNIPNLNMAILESFFSSDTEATQRLGRLMRLNHNEQAYVYVLLPYFMKQESDSTFSVQETQQVNWARKMLRSTKISSSEVWDYRVVKTNKK